jgi:hypothetical protein
MGMIIILRSQFKLPKKFAISIVEILVYPTGEVDRLTVKEK